MQVNDLLKCVNVAPLPKNTIAPDLKLGEEYPLKEIHTCSCGKQHFNVGLPMEVNFVECHDCRETLPSHTHWAHPSRFILAPAK